MVFGGKMKTHVELLGWINIVSGALAAVAGLIVFVVLVGSGLLSRDWEAMGVLSIVAVCVSSFMFLLAAPSILAGIGLLKRKAWARPLTLILSILALFNFPVGTIIAIYAFWVLLSDETTPLLAAG